MNREVRTISYIEARPGDRIDYVAEEARADGVSCFLHNGTLYRVVAYERVAEVDPTMLRRLSEVQR